MTGLKWGSLSRRFSAAYVTFKANKLDLGRDDLSGAEGGWPVQTRRVRCGIGEIDEQLWPWVDYVTGRQSLPPEGADDLAKKNRMHHYQRIRTGAECKKLCERNVHFIRSAMPYVAQMGYRHEVIRTLGEDPANQIKFAARILKQYASVDVSFNEFRENRPLQAAVMIALDLDSPLSFLDSEGNRAIPPSIIPEHGIRASFEITKQWTKAPGGVIKIPSSNEEIIGSHDVNILGFDLKSERFVFENTWGEEWGNKGIGFLPYDYFDRHLIEAWTFGFPDIKPTLVEGNGVQVLRWQSPDLFGDTLYGREVYDRTDDEKMAWLFAVVRDGHLDVEELFVRPEFRSEGWGARLSEEAKTLAASLGIPLRIFVPFADAEADDSALKKLIRRLGLVLQPSQVRWAAYRAVPAGEALSTDVIVRIPPRPTFAPQKKRGGVRKENDAPETNRYHCRAEMEEEVEVDKIVSVEVPGGPGLLHDGFTRVLMGWSP